MGYVKKLLKYVTNKDYRFLVNSMLFEYRKMPDREYIERRFHAKLGRMPDLENPKTFNEKLQWLKLHDRRPEYSELVDKYEAKKYVAARIGEEHIVPTLGVWDSFAEIDFSALPDQFVLKCTHDSGGLVICRDKASLDLKKAEKKINKSLHRNFYYFGREWPYKNVKPRILAERYMEDEITAVAGLTDFKFYCFGGEPKYLYVSAGLENHRTASISFLTLDWAFAPFRRSDYKPFAELPKKPVHFEQMIELAKQLSAGHPFLRVDLYEVGGQIYFSEMTFFPNSGFMPFDPPEWDRTLGDMLILPPAYTPNDRTDAKAE
ncbi:MAG: glycosyl transferase [Clostridia bacterium]|nr:glycosyl transferase [Clostridia bacterium]